MSEIKTIMLPYGEVHRFAVNEIGQAFLLNEGDETELLSGDDKTDVIAALFAALTARDAEIERLTKERNKAQENYQFMVNRAADEKLDGYRGLGARAASAENSADALRREVAELREAVRAAHGSVWFIEGREEWVNKHPAVRRALEEVREDSE